MPPAHFSFFIFSEACFVASYTNERSLSLEAHLRSCSHAPANICLSAHATKISRKINSTSRKHQSCQCRVELRCSSIQSKYKKKKKKIHNTNMNFYRKRKLNKTYFPEAEKPAPTSTICPLA